MPGAFDTGLIQKDSIQVNLPASLHAVETLYSHEAKLIGQETGFINRGNIGLVVAAIGAELGQNPLRIIQQLPAAKLARIAIVQRQPIRQF